MKKTMKTSLSVGILFGVLVNGQVMSQPFSSGSTGADGPLNVTNNLTLNLPPNGIFNFTTINITNGATLIFNRNPLNTPVYLLATSNVFIDGVINVSGQAGSASAGGRGGPGGFDGGFPGLDTNTPPGAGYGPGAGRRGIGFACFADTVGSASYGTLAVGPSTNSGPTYGSPLLMPLIGGSGGGGQPNVGGGGGGGAILIASSTAIHMTGSGRIAARGSPFISGFFGMGSGGAIRLVAPSITGGGFLDASGEGHFSPCSYSGGHGRIRIDTTNRRTVVFGASPPASIGANMAVFPTPNPRLDIVEAAGTIIPEGNAGPVQIQLPFGSTTNRTVTVQARDFNAVVPINVVLTPDSGDPVVYPLTIDNAAANPAQATANVVVPVNAVVTVNAWTRQ